MEQVEERVVRDDSSGKVTERITRRYDPQGNPLPPERQMIEEQKRADGGSTVQSTTYRADLNGNMQVIEKSQTDTQKSASSDVSETVVQRLTPNGLQPVEKQSQVVSKQGNGGYQADSTTYRSDGNGGFTPALRQTTEHIVQGSQVSDNSAEYERDSYGQLALHGQTVTKTVTGPDGLKQSVVDIYSTNVPGTVSGSGSAMKLQEEQTIDSQPGPGNTVVQTLSVRRPTVSDPGSAGAGAPAFSDRVQRRLQAAQKSRQVIGYYNSVSGSTSITKPVAGHFFSRAKRCKPRSVSLRIFRSAAFNKS